LKFFANELSNIVYDLYKNSVITLPSSYLKNFFEITKKETNKVASLVLSILYENINISSQKMIPICQDTGIPVFFIEIGYDLTINGNIYEAVNSGVKKACDDGYVRASVCDPLTRINTGTNSPAIIHTNYIPGNSFQISIVPKGCGSENMSAVWMLSPSQGINGIVEKIVGQVKKAGPNPCPPLFLGVGIGGDLEYSALLSKKALVFNDQTISENSDLEKKIFNEVNKLNIGPMGLGGNFTCTGVKALTSPCHIASLPVALNIQCHAARSLTALWNNHEWEMNNDTQLINSFFNKPDFKILSDINMQNLDLPINSNKLNEIKPGEWYLLTGELLTARDQTLMKLFNDIDNGNPLPYSFNNSTIYFTGPSPAQNKNIIGSCGPTSSYRMKPYIQKLINLGVNSIIGKGYSPVTTEKMLYFATIGGAGAYLSEKIVSCETIAYSELGPEAIMRLYVKDFPVIAIHSMDSDDFYIKKG